MLHKKCGITQKKCLTRLEKKLRTRTAITAEIGKNLADAWANLVTSTAKAASLEEAEKLCSRKAANMKAIKSKLMGLMLVTIKPYFEAKVALNRSLQPLHD